MKHLKFHNGQGSKMNAKLGVMATTDEQNKINFRKIDNCDNIPVKFKLKKKLRQMQTMNFGQKGISSLI